MNKKSKFNRVLLKLTGEFLCPPNEKGIEFSQVDVVTRGILNIQKNTGCEIALVVGGGNLMRGRDASQGVDKATADNIGMLGTIMNGLALEESLNRLGGGNICVLMTSLSIPSIAQPFIRKKALKYLNEGKILVLAGGTGNPFFTTDSAAALRAAELNCDVVLKGSTVDGVYTADPHKVPTAKRYKYLTYQTALVDNLQVMDNNAFAMCQREEIPILVFEAEDLADILQGNKIGTLISSDKGDEFFE